jgi:tRNA threonylcarbamoyladenosine biosynthesis protein TsaE
MIETSKSPQETKELAKKLIKKLKGGEILGLVGELGSGKTVFVQGLAVALGIKDIVNSPTFILMKKYQIPSRLARGLSARNKKLVTNKFQITSPKHLIHIDAYRLESFDQLKEIGVEEYLNNNECLVAVEWADKVKEIKSYSNYIEIKFIETKKQNERIIEMSKLI